MIEEEVRRRSLVFGNMQFRKTLKIMFCVEADGSHGEQGNEYGEQTGGKH